MRLLTDIESFIADSADLLVPAVLVFSGLSLYAVYTAV